MQKPVQMWDDERPIRGITMVGESGDYWSVGRAGITCIVVYRENEGASAPWFAVYESNHLAYRVNAAHVESVWYGAPPDQE